MHVNNYTLPRPDQHLLDQCTEVLIGNPAFKMWKMRKWCYENVSSQFDEVAAFYFIDDQDATVFTLKFK
jgi:hypothetical protein